MTSTPRTTEGINILLPASCCSMYIINSLTQASSRLVQLLSEETTKGNTEKHKLKGTRDQTRDDVQLL